MEIYVVYLVSKYDGISEVHIFLTEEKAQEKKSALEKFWTPMPEDMSVCMEKEEIL